jgi:hypothetical protein
MSAGPKPSFGFEGLSDIQPTPMPAPARQPVEQEIDRAAERLGFTSREAAVRRRRRQPEDPTDQLNIRAAIPDINRFVDWCEQNRYSYREGFAELVKLIGRD